MAKHKNMLEKHKMNRINELARASKTRELDAEELAEQKVLRGEYLAKFRASFRAQLDQIEIVDGDMECPASGRQGE